ncbi:MAG: efflux transporter, family, subunit [Rhodospirillales bacterium]|nr:efflux transporter, family, subunit [Rhodospirillales bacterium]
MTPYDHSPSAIEAYGFVPHDHALTVNRSDVRDRGRTRLARRIGWGTAVTFGVLLAFGAVQHFTSHHAAVAAMEARQQAVPKVRVEPVKVTTAPRDLSLPGTTMAFESATIFARQSGYVGDRRVDIGSKVKAGDVLAVITAPEIDDQLTQARAQLIQMQAALKQAQANHGLAAATDRRTVELVSQGWQSKQQGDTDRANLDAQAASVGVAQANISAQQAQVARLEKEKAYEQVIAPFDGVITQRSIDTGSLVTADSTSGSSMFAIARTNVLRVQINVPQDAVPGLKEGVVADITVPEMPGRTFTGHVARTAEALQAGTRTLLVEVDVDNADGALAAGVYCTVKFEVPRTNPVLEIPAEALIFNRDGTQVAVYQDGKANIRKVSLAEDDGDHVDIATGLQPNDQVIVSLPVDLTDGAPVAVRDMKAQTAKAGS